MLFSDVYDNFLPWKKRLVKESTMGAYSLICKNYLTPFFGKMRIDEIGRKEVKEFVNGLFDNCELSNKSIKDILIVLKMIIRFASEELEIDVRDTNWKIKFPTDNDDSHGKVETYSPEDVSKIIDYCLQNANSRNIGVLLSLCTGMRIGEICGLTWNDIDVAAKTVTVNKTIERIYDVSTNKTKIVISQPKTKTSQRVIPLMNEIVPLLKKFKALYNAEYYVTSCTDKFSEPRTYRVWYKNFVNEILGEGKALKFHSCRHSFATMMITNGADVKTVATILGHADVSTTLNIYCKPSDADKRSAMAKVFKKTFKK